MAPDTVSAGSGGSGGSGGSAGSAGSGDEFPTCDSAAEVPQKVCSETPLTAPQASPGSPKVPKASPGSPKVPKASPKVRP